MKLFFVKPRPQTFRKYKPLKGKVRQKERRVEINYIYHKIDVNH